MEVNCYQPLQDKNTHLTEAAAEPFWTATLVGLLLPCFARLALPFALWLLSFALRLLAAAAAAAAAASVSSSIGSPPAQPDMQTRECADVHDQLSNPSFQSVTNPTQISRHRHMPQKDNLPVLKPNHITTTGKGNLRNLLGTCTRTSESQRACSAMQGLLQGSTCSTPCTQRCSHSLSTSALMLFILVPPGQGCMTKYWGLALGM